MNTDRKAKMLFIYEDHEYTRNLVRTSIPQEACDQLLTNFLPSFSLTFHAIANHELTELNPTLFNAYDIIVIFNIRMPSPNGYDIVDFMERERVNVPLICGSFAVGDGEPEKLLKHARSRIRYCQKFVPGMTFSLVHAIHSALLNAPVVRLTIPVTYCSTFDEQSLSLLGSNPEDLFKLEPRTFEALIAELLGRDGWSVGLTGRSADGGVDIWAARKITDINHRMLVQAKRNTRHRKVGVEIIREVMYLVDRHSVNSALIATTSLFTRCAKEERDLHPWRLHLKDHEAIVAWLGQHGGTFRSNLKRDVAKTPRLG